MGRKKGEKQSAWSVYRKKEVGELHDHNVVKNPLPPVGSYVVVRRAEVHPRGKGKNLDIKVSHFFDDTCLDAMGRPLVYQVVEYKLGIEKPTSRANAVHLVATTRSGFQYHKYIDTIRATNGYYLLEIQESSKQIYEAEDVYNASSDDNPVGEFITMVRDEKENYKRKHTMKARANKNALKKKEKPE